MCQAHPKAAVVVHETPLQREVDKLRLENEALRAENAQLRTENAELKKGARSAHSLSRHFPPLTL